MAEYLRNRVAGGCYFFTVNLADRGSDLLTAEIGVLRRVVGAVRGRYPFHVDAWVVLPEHMHCVWTLPLGDDDFPLRWAAIKAGFSREMGKSEGRRASLVRRRESGVWQRRYWEHTIRDAQDYAAHVDYVHFNPVKHGLVTHAVDWPFSSFRRCVARGVYPADWSGGEVVLGGGGERG